MKNPKFHEKTELLKDIFIKNEYPQFCIDKCIKYCLSKLFVPKRIIHTVDKKQVLLVFHFLVPLFFEIGPVYKNVSKITSLITYQRWYTSPKVERPICLTLKILLIPGYAHMLFANSCIVPAT